ncbi:MAG: hypothetical protein AB8F95_16195 [Bacteroidia bacterium]
MDLKSTREAYISKLKDQLDELNETMDTLQAKGENTTGAAKERFDEKMGELGLLKEDLSANLDALRITTEDSWHELKDTLDGTMDRVSDIARDSLRKMIDFFK